ncbi:MAG: protein-disulfide reductase DsbD family protein [Candidatus Sumerlaeaceae bacterium]
MNSSHLLRCASLLVLFIIAATPAFAADVDVAARLASQGVILTLLGVFGAGILVSLTPCLYPMIPITLSIIGARSAGQKPLTGFLRSFVFVLGIAVVYTALGLVAVSFGKSIDFLLRYKTFWLLLALFFIAMGISMLGAFQIQLPARFTGKLQGSTSGKGGFIGAFLIGLVTGVAASPCGSPVLAGLMAFGAQNSNRPVLIVSLFFAYAFGMGMLFMVLGTFPAFLKSMPKSGGWMDDVKKFLGAVLIGVGLYYLQNAMRAMPGLYWLIVIATALAGGLYIAIKAQARRNTPGLLLAWRITGVALALFAIYAAVAKFPLMLQSGTRSVATNGRPVYSPEKLIAEAKSVLSDDQKFAQLAKQSSPAQPASATAPVAKIQGEPPHPAEAPKPADTQAAPAAAPASHADWLTDEPVGLALAKKEGKPVIIDFGAEWCAACKELERDTFPISPVAEELQKFVKVRIDCTEASDATDALQKKYGSTSLPTVAFIGKDGKWKKDLTLFTFEKPDKFLERLKKVQQ